MYRHAGLRQICPRTTAADVARSYVGAAFRRPVHRRGGSSDPPDQRMFLESDMAGRECYHCKQWVEQGEAHDCWTTTETALTKDLSEDLRDAWERLRETAADFGEQRIYASHNSIMFSRTSCYFFVRPKKSFLEVCLFLPRAVKAPQVKRAMASSKTKFANMIQIRHRDEVESPITDWLQEAYGFAGVPPAAVRRGGSLDPPDQRKPKKKAAPKKAKRTARARGPKRAARPRR